MDPMTTKASDSVSRGPRDGIDEEAQTHEITVDKGSGEWRPYVTLLALVFACVLLFTLNDSRTWRVDNAKVLESVRADIREIKETLYARTHEPVDSDTNVMAYAVPDVTYTADTDTDTRNLVLRHTNDDARDLDAGYNADSRDPYTDSDAQKTFEPEDEYLHAQNTFMRDDDEPITINLRSFVGDLLFKYGAVVWRRL